MSDMSVSSSWSKRLTEKWGSYVTRLLLVKGGRRVDRQQFPLYSLSRLAQLEYAIAAHPLMPSE